ALVSAPSGGGAAVPNGPRSLFNLLHVDWSDPPPAAGDRLLFDATCNALTVPGSLVDRSPNPAGILSLTVPSAPAPQGSSPVSGSPLAKRLGDGDSAALWERGASLGIWDEEGWIVGHDCAAS